MDISDSPSIGPENAVDSSERVTVAPILACNTQVRHGFDTISEEWMSQLVEGYYTYFADKRHEMQGKAHPGDSVDGGDWRVTDRQRTVNAALVLCLNLGVDPPDIIKTQPAARLEAWVDPQQYVDSKKALEQIGKNLQAQYESLSSRTKYKQSLDPTIDDIKRFCVGLRRSARDDRILFHYNGHGVPRPTPSGEVWVFNRGYTQYIPLSVYELQTWLGAPVIYCYDCSGAENILNSFNEFVKKRKQLQAEEAAKDKDAGAQNQSSAGAASVTYAYETCIQLGACRADEVLPMNPDLPADLFTCCISTPVDTAVKWFLIQNSRGFASSGLEASSVQIPGKITDRRTPLGELNWIFTAITDTIAWSMLDPKLFKRLFRQDLIVAAMFRNFLLAKRIMGAHNCHPVSSPPIPDTCSHPLWDSWDAAINHCLLQATSSNPSTDGRLFSDFFEQQLTAFEMWLNYQSTDVGKPPEQLPIVLQVLLSQIHRLRALSLLCRYLDLGPKAVKIALSIGFFIYVLKLLQSPAPELRPVLVFIWARIMAVHRPVQTDLVKDQCYMYFVNILTDGADSSETEEAGVSQAKIGDAALCCFILAQFSHEYPSAQQLLSNNSDLLDVVEHNLEADSPLLRQWSILLLAELVQTRSISIIIWRFKDPIPEVRAAVLYAFKEYFSRGQLSDADSEMVGKAVVSVALDGSPLVRYELVVFLSNYMFLNESKFLVCAFTTLEEEFAASRYGGDMRSQSPAHGTVCLALWRCLLVLTDDAMPHVKSSATSLVDHFHAKLMRTPLSDEVSQMASVLLEPSELRKVGITREDTVTNHRMRVGAEEAVNSEAPAQSFSDDVQHILQKQQVSKPTESFLRYAIHWVVGRDPTDESSCQSKTASLKPRRSLASLVPELASSPSGSTASPSSLSTSASSSSSEQTIGSIGPFKSSSSADNANRTIAGDTHRRDLILTSDFREFCVEYFREPLLRLSEADEAGSKLHIEKDWRKSRNEKIMAETQVQKGLAVTGSWGNQINSLEGVGEPARKMVFAQFEPHLIAADSSDVVVFNWQRAGQVINRFHGGRDLSDIQFLNEDDVPLVLTASRDGLARVFKNYEDPNLCHIVTSWWLFADLVHHQPHNPLVLIDWQQSRGNLLVGGDARVVRIWDAAREQAVFDMPVRTSSQLTALTSDKVAGNLVFAGFSDGAIHVYDHRLDKQQALIRRWKPAPSGLHTRSIGHSSKVLNLRMQRGGPREVASGSSDGLVCLWDIRNSSPISSFQAHNKDMRCMDLHEHAPVIATASRVAGVWSTAGRRVSTLKGPSASLLSSRISPVGSIVFHPHQMVLAMSNAEEPAINVFKCT